MNSVQLREKRAALIEQMNGLVAAAQAEGRSLNAEEGSKFDAMENDANELKANFERVERSEAMRKELAAKREESNEQRAASAKPEQRAVFAKFLRHGINSLSAEERAEMRGTSTQIEGTDSLGGFLVPEDFSNALDVAMKFAGPVEQLAQVLNTTTGAPLPYPTVDDTSVDWRHFGRSQRRHRFRHDLCRIEFGRVHLHVQNRQSFSPIVARQRV
jgi:HK97 family phage major capsid protein